jgi:PBP1b-binding outer membrane lipoprotein LpoB
MIRKILSVFLVALIVAGCKPSQQTQTTASQDGKYSEDLSVLRPKIETQQQDPSSPDKIKRDPKAYVEPQFTVNKRLDAVLDSIDQINLSRKFIEGYTIQVYSGLKKEEALNAKRQLSQTVPNLNSELQYEQPNFKVKSGRYYTRLEAERDFEEIKRYFPSAIVVPGQIGIN